jgi:hypothetical protein
MPFQLQKFVGKWDLNKVLIVGDSFGADWSAKYRYYPGWPQLLQKHFSVENLAQAGCSEFRILQQLKSRNLNLYNWIIICHTSPDRVYVPRHPVHSNDVLHHSSDLIYTDIEYHANKLKNWCNKKIQTAWNYFRYYYSDEYQIYVYNKIREDIQQITGTIPVLHINNFASTTHYSKNLDFVQLREDHAGLINHLSAQGNWIVYKQILQALGHD